MVEIEERDSGRCGEFTWRRRGLTAFVAIVAVVGIAACEPDHSSAPEESPASSAFGSAESTGTSANVIDLGTGVSRSQKGWSYRATSGPFTWVGTHCGAGPWSTEPGAGDWKATATGNLDGVEFTQVMIISATTDGRATWTMTGTLVDGDGEAASQTGGTGEWWSESATGDVRFDLTRDTEALQASSGEQGITIWPEQMKSLMLRWTASSC